MTQATVRAWSEEEGGSAYLDSGEVVVLPPGCLAGGPFRFLRSGQRVQLTLSEGTVGAVTLPG